MKITKQIAYFNGEQWIDSEGDPLDDVNRKIGGYDGRKIIAICGSQLYRTLGYHDLLREVFGVGNLMVDNGEDNGEDDDEDDDEYDVCAPRILECWELALLFHVADFLVTDAVQGLVFLFISDSA